MNGLLDKYNDYLRLVGCTAEYELSNGNIISVAYKKENFPHLIGLHKLKDIQLLQFWQDRTNKSVKLNDVLRHIKKETLTESTIRSSVFYGSIKDRYENFSYDNLTTLNYTDAVVDFNPLIINSKIKSKYILFEERSGNQYNHMGIAMDPNTGDTNIETFFHQDSDMYIAGQIVVKIKSFSIRNLSGKVIVEDKF